METVETVAEMEQYLTFEVAGEIYAIGILDLREIISFQSATRVPMAPKSIRGLINLRGSAVPVIDLAMKFGDAPPEITKKSCVVIFDASESKERGMIGILADSVNEVIELSSDEIEPAPDFGATVSAKYLAGLARVSDQFIPILDVDRLLSAEEMAITQDGLSEVEVEVEEPQPSSLPASVDVDAVSKAPSLEVKIERDGPTAQEDGVERPKKSRRSSKRKNS